MRARAGARRRDPLTECDGGLFGRVGRGASAGGGVGRPAGRAAHGGAAARSPAPLAAGHHLTTDRAPAAHLSPLTTCAHTGPHRFSPQGSARGPPTAVGRASRLAASRSTTAGRARAQPAGRPVRRRRPARYRRADTDGRQTTWRRTLVSRADTRRGAAASGEQRTADLLDRGQT